MLSVVLYGCQTSSLVLKEEIDKGCLRTIFRPPEDEMIGEWRKMHDEKLYIILTLHQILFWLSDQGGIDG